MAHRVKIWGIRSVGLVGAVLAVLPGVAAAQGLGGGRHGGRREAPGAAAPAVDAPKPVPEPVQRLDAGAVLCNTEEALQQHQAAVLARRDGREGNEPVGCRLVQSRIAVAVLERHGSSHTEVRLPGQPEQVGWTDVVVRNR